MPTQTQEFIKKEVRASDLLNAEIMWEKGGSPIFPYLAIFEGVKCVIRVNDFPEEALFTLIIEDREKLDFDDWPAQWKRP